jgi:tetratricopeptide (TPR) repeat protein
MYLVSNQFYKPELARLQGGQTQWDRAHNDAYDSIVSTGILGLAATLIFFVGVFYYALCRLRLIRSRSDRVLFFAVAVAAAIISLIAPWIAGAPHLAGIILGPALVVCIVIYAAYSAFGGTGLNDRLNDVDSALIALLGAVVAHFVEIDFGMVSTVTRMHVFLFIGILIVMGTRGQSVLGGQEIGLGQEISRSPAASEGARKRDRPSSVRHKIRLAWPQFLPHALMISLVLMCLDWDLMFNGPGESSALAIFWRSLTEISRRNGQSAAGLGAIYSTALIATVGVVLARRDLQSVAFLRSWAWKALGIIAGLAGSIWLVYGLFHSSRLVPPSGTLSPQAATDYVSAPFDGFVVWVGLIIACLAAILWSCDLRPGTGRVSHSASAIIFGGLAILAGVVFIDRVVLQPLRADIYYKSATPARDAHEEPQYLFFLNQAVITSPSQDKYLYAVSQALVDSAFGKRDQTVRQTLLDRAEANLRRALELSPLETLYMRGLAAYYVARAERESDSATRLALVLKALALLQDASILAPANSDLFREWGHAYSILAKNNEAREMYRKSLVLDSRNDGTYMMIGEYESGQGNLEEALQAYTAASQINRNNVAAQVNRVLLLKRLGRYSEAVASIVDAWAVNIDNAAGLDQLSRMYDELGDLRRALAYAERAYALWPPEQQSAYQPTIRKLSERLGQENSGSVHMWPNDRKR